MISTHGTQNIAKPKDPIARVTPMHYSVHQQQGRRNIAILRNVYRDIVYRLHYKYM